MVFDFDFEIEYATGQINAFKRLKTMEKNRLLYNDYLQFLKEKQKPILPPQVVDSKIISSGKISYMSSKQEIQYEMDKKMKTDFLSDVDVFLCDNLLMDCYRINSCFMNYSFVQSTQEFIKNYERTRNDRDIILYNQPTDFFKTRKPFYSIPFISCNLEPEHKSFIENERFINARNFTSWEDVNQLVQYELYMFNIQHLHVSSVTANEYILSNGCRIIHNGLFLLDDFPEMSYRESVYSVDIYYGGRIFKARKEILNTNEKITLDTLNMSSLELSNHLGCYVDDTVKKAYDDMILCNIGRADSGQAAVMYRVCSLMKAGIIEKDSDNDYWFQHIAYKHNPYYVFGFDRLVPFANYGLLFLSFMVQIHEQLSYQGQTILGDSMIENRHYGIYLFLLSFILNKFFPYEAIYDLYDDK